MKLLSTLILAAFISSSLCFAGTPDDNGLSDLITQQEQKIASEQAKYQEQLAGVKDMRAQVGKARKSKNTASVISIPVMLIGAGLLGGGIYLTKSANSQPMPFAFGMVLGISGTVTLVGGGIYFYVKHSQLKKLESVLEKNETLLQEKLVELANDQMTLQTLKTQADEQ